MSRKKLTKLGDIVKADTRIAGMKSISTSLDLGNGLTISSYQTTINNAKVSVETYNTLLSSVDEAHNKAINSLAALKDMNERMLSGIVSKHGKDSNEYEMAGGVRKSARKKPQRKVKDANS